MNLGPILAPKSGFTIRWSLIKANPYALGMGRSAFAIANRVTADAKNLVKEQDQHVKRDKMTVNLSLPNMVALFFTPNS